YGCAHLGVVRKMFHFIMLLRCIPIQPFSTCLHNVANSHCLEDMVSLTLSKFSPTASVSTNERPSSTKILVLSGEKVKQIFILRRCQDSRMH
uniref:Ovule protein n=1 Tax=Haemonchus contortus TaxID=6289 RepID=A0A7I4YD74_HAECO